MIFTWFTFIIIVSLMLIIARRNLWLGLFTGALLLGIVNLPILTLAKVILNVFTDPAVLLLALAVSIIPLIGGVLSTTHLINDLVGSLKLRARTFMVLAPAIFGLLPMPGGALLSAPLVARVNDKIKPADYAAINVWFRHILVMIYPLGGLLATSRMANQNVYKAMVILIPAFLVMSSLGIIFLLRPVNPQLYFPGSDNKKKIFIPLAVIFTAPILHIILMNLFPKVLPEIPLVLGVGCSLGVGLAASRLDWGGIREVIRKSTPGRYFLIILGMFSFLRVFQATPLVKAIAGMQISPVTLVVGIGFLLGALTGRAQLAFSLLFPIYSAKYGENSLTVVSFAIMYFSVFMGYLMSPVHPCILVTLEYFKTEIIGLYKKIALPFLITYLGLFFWASWYF